MHQAPAQREKETVDVDEAINRDWRFIERGDDLLVRARDVAQDVKQRVAKVEPQDATPNQLG
jgi:hypothetical protein